MAAIAAAAAVVKQGIGHPIYLDECDLHLLPVIRSIWMKGTRVRVPTPGTNTKRAFFGAADAVGGTFHWAEHDRNLAVHFVEFLAQLAATYATGPILLVLDNVITHDAQIVRAWLAPIPGSVFCGCPSTLLTRPNPSNGSGV